jgi:hypothetical protein
VVRIGDGYSERIYEILQEESKLQSKHDRLVDTDEDVRTTREARDDVNTQMINILTRRNLSSQIHEIDIQIEKSLIDQDEAEAASVLLRLDELYFEQKALNSRLQALPVPTSEYDVLVTTKKRMEKAYQAARKKAWCARVTDDEEEKGN